MRSKGADGRPRVRGRLELFNSLASALVLIAAAGGCGAGGDGPGWTVTDSAGVEIVTSDSNAPAWVAEARPMLELGAADEPGPTEFYRVRDVELLPGGGIVVANGGSEELRFFGPDGSYQGGVGRRGHGPTEFDGLSMIESFGDSLLTWDGGNQRVSVRTLDGAFVRAFRLEWFDGILFPTDLLGGSGMTGERGILAVTARHMTQLEGVGLLVDTALVSVYDMDGRLIDSIARLPHNARVVRRVGNLQTTLGAPYSGGASIVGVDDGLCHTFGPEPEIRCHGRAGPIRVIRVGLAPRPVTESDVDTFWEEALETASERQRSALQRMRDDLVFPEAFPAFAQLLRDDAAGSGRAASAHPATPPRSGSCSTTRG